MPRKSDLITIKDENLDRRTKLTTIQKKEIFMNKECLSQRKLADLYGVSRRTIQFILDPEKLKENKLRRKERGGSKEYYDKQKNTDAQREHRNYKKELYKKGLIK